MENINPNLVRTLKVYRRFNEIKLSKNPNIPEIRLKGVWLKSWGFNCGSEVQIVKTDFGILISKKEDYPPRIKL